MRTDLWRVSFILLSDIWSTYSLKDSKVFSSYESFLSHIQYLVNNHAITEYCTCMYIDPLNLPVKEIQERLKETYPSNSIIVTEAKFIFRLPSKEDV